VYRSAILLIATLLRAATLDLSGNAVDPFAGHAAARVLIFVRTDCPITNRYAPELKRIYNEFASRGVTFWLVYPDRDENPAHVRSHVAEFGFPGTPVLDPGQELVSRAHARVAPEAAVFDSSNKLVYHGRIDDRWVDFGKSRPDAQVHDLEDAIAATVAGKPVAHSATRAVGCSLADLR
jgi:hypothetical protein